MVRPPPPDPQLIGTQTHPAPRPTDPNWVVTQPQVYRRPPKIREPVDHFMMLVVGLAVMFFVGVFGWLVALMVYDTWPWCLLVIPGVAVAYGIGRFLYTLDERRE